MRFKLVALPDHANPCWVSTQPHEGASHFRCGLGMVESDRFIVRSNVSLGKSRRVVDARGRTSAPEKLRCSRAFAERRKLLSA